MRQLAVEIMLLFAIGGGAYFYGRHEQNHIDQLRIDSLTSTANLERQKIQDQLTDVQAHALESYKARTDELTLKQNEINDLKDKLAKESHNYELLRGRLLVVKPQASTVSNDSPTTRGGGSLRPPAIPTQGDTSGNVTGLDITRITLWANEAYNKWQTCVSQYEALEKAYNVAK
jgi:hypothetical protein